MSLFINMYLVGIKQQMIPMYKIRDASSCVDVNVFRL